MKEYLIKKNKHYPSGIHLGLTFSKYIYYECMFNENCLYTIEGEDKYDINKLFGFSTTYFHQKQSARVGWRCIDGKNIQLLTYSYNDGVREPQEADMLGVVKPNEKFRCSIVDLEQSYLYTFKMSDGTRETFFHDKKKPDWFFFNYLLRPFFGGNKTAPHDMVIYLNKL